MRSPSLGCAGLTRRLLPALFVLAALGLLPGSAQAAVTTFGSNLAVPATENTAQNLSYPGVNATQYGTGANIHTYHDGADTALWNVTLPDGTPTAPAAGQVLSFRLEGCAEQAPGGPPPLTQFHFQDLKPGAGGAVTVNVTSQPFDIPVCGQPAPSGGTASGSTISTYQPTNFCVAQGDLVDFNDEGGFDPDFYTSGAPYEVIGATPGATMDSFILGDGTNNGDTLSPSLTDPMHGFATNNGEQLLLQATLGTGPDATPLCPGGTQGVSAPKPPAPVAGQAGGPPAVVLHPQTDGVNHSRYVGLALFCALPATPCVGTVTLTSGKTKLATSALSAPAKKTAHLKLRITPAALKMIRKHHRRLSALMTVTLPGGGVFSQPITLKI